MEKVPDKEERELRRQFNEECKEPGPAERELKNPTISRTLPEQVKLFRMMKAAKDRCFELGRKFRELLAKRRSKE